MKWPGKNSFSKADSVRDGNQDTFPLMQKKASCYVCDATRTFTKVWRRAEMVVRCQNCGLVFEDPTALYKRLQPACPNCEEPLEQPGFEYGYCDQCGSKFELMDGTKPGLLPNQAQRDKMKEHGKSWSSS